MHGLEEGLKTFITDVSSHSIIHPLLILVLSGFSPLKTPRKNRPDLVDIPGRFQ